MTVTHVWCARFGQSLPAELHARCDCDAPAPSETVEPTVGMPATIHLYSDTRAAVVVKVNRGSILVRVVETDPATRTRVNDMGEPFPCVAEEGILGRPVGEAIRYRRTPEGGYRSGSIWVTLGRSVKITDYRH